PQSKSFLSAVFGDGCGEEPLFQHGEKLRAGLAESHANAEIGLRVDNGSGRFKEFSLAVNLDLDLRVLRQGIGHVQVAAVEAELSHARGDTGLRGLVNPRGGGDEGITRRSATLISHWAFLRKAVAAIVSLVAGETGTILARGRGPSLFAMGPKASCIGVCRIPPTTLPATEATSPQVLRPRAARSLVSERSSNPS